MSSTIATHCIPGL